MIKAIIRRIVGGTAAPGLRSADVVAPSASQEPRPDKEGLLSLIVKIGAQIQEVNLSEEEQYIFAEKAAMSIYPKFRFSEFGRLWLNDQEFFDDYIEFMDPGNWHSADRKFMLNQFLNSTAGIDGDFAECGAYAGGSAIFMCRTAVARGRHVHLFDSFEGLSAPNAYDGSYWAKGALASAEDRIRANLERYSGQFTTYKGWIPSRFTEVEKKQFAFVHIDVDLYEPTRDSLEFFYPRVPSGGILLLDDHGFSSCPGARKAAIEFFDGKPERIIDVTTGQGLIVKR